MWSRKHRCGHLQRRVKYDLRLLTKAVAVLLRRTVPAEGGELALMPHRDAGHKEVGLSAVLLTTSPGIWAQAGPMLCISGQVRSLPGLCMACE